MQLQPLFLWVDLTSFEDAKLHGRMAWGEHGLPKVSPEPAMPNPLTPLQPLPGQPAAVFYPFGHPTPYAYVKLLYCR
jgi:hypothetical protein